MPENILIASIIGTVVLLMFALWIFKDKLGVFSFKASKNSVTAELKRHKNTGITISGNTQDGNGNGITAEIENTSIEDNTQKGDNNIINAITKKRKNI